MAGAGYVIKTGITFDTKQARAELNKLAEGLNVIIQKYNETAKELKKAQDAGDANAEAILQKELNRQKKIVDAEKKMLDLYKTSIEKIQNALSDLSGRTVRELQAIEKEIQSEMKQLALAGDSQTKEMADFLARGLRNVRNELDNVKKGFTDLKGQMKDLDGKSLDSLQQLLLRLRANREAMSEKSDGTFSKKTYDEIGHAMQGIIAQMEKLTGLQRTLSNITKATPNALREGLDFYKKWVATGELNKNQLKEAEVNVKALNEELAKRSMNVLNNSDRHSMEEIKEASAFLREYGNQLGINNPKQNQFNEALAKGELALKKYSDAQKQSMMSTQLKDVTHLTDDALSGQIKYWKSVLSGLDSSDKKYKTYVANLQKVEQEQAKRLAQEEAIAQAELKQKRRGAEDTLTTGLNSSSINDIKDAIKLIEVLRDEQVKGGAEWVKYSTMITNATEHLNAFDEAVKKVRADQELQQRRNSASQTLTTGLTTSSIKEIQDAIKVIEVLRDEQIKGGTEWKNYSAMIDNATMHLKSFDEAAKRAELMRQRFKSERTLTVGLTSSSINDVRESIKVIEQLRDEQVKGGVEWKKYSDMIDNATHYLNAFDESAKRLKEAQKLSDDRILAMDTLSNLNTNSVKDIKEAIKVIELLRDEQARGSAAWQSYADMVDNAKNYLNAFDEVAKKAKETAEWRDKANSAGNIMGNLGTSSVKEIREAIRVFEKLRDEQTRGSAEWESYSNWIDYAKEHLKAYDDTAKRTMMEDKFNNLATLSKSALNEQNKYWKELMDNAERGSIEFLTFEDRLKYVNAEINNRIKDEGELTSLQVKAGMFDGTIKETKEAIAQLKKYRELLNKDFDTDAIKDADAAIQKLELDLKLANAGFRNMDEVLDAAEQAGKGKFTGTIQDVKTLRTLLEEYKKGLGAMDGDKLTNVDKLLKGLEGSTSKATLTQQRYNEVLAKPKSATYEELKEAASRLKKELESCERHTKKYVDASRKLAEVKAEIKDVEAEWKEHKNTLQEAFSRLKSYVLIYIGFQEFMAKMRDFFSMNLELSDQMTNVAKVTGMTKDEIDGLVDSLQKIDTRTTTAELMQFAEQAGKLGIYTEHGAKGMQEFVQMAERINATLGEDIGGAEAVASLAKVNDILGETDKMQGSVSRALDATGSAILNVGNNSAASYAAITNYVGRLGAIGSASKMSMTDLIALGGTLDALKMPAEAGSTALAQFLSSMQNHTEELAKAAGVSVVELRKQINGYVDEMGNLVAPDMMGALKTLLGTVRDGAASAQDLMNAMTGRSRTNVNIRSTLMLLSGHMDMLDQQIAYAKEGYDSIGDAVNQYETNITRVLNKQSEVSIMSKEFDKMNQNAAGILQRLKNSLVELFVNSQWVGRFRSILASIADFIESLRKSEEAMAIVKAALTSLAVGFATTVTGINSFVVALFRGELSLKSFWGTMSKIGKFMKNNWFTILATAATFLITAIAELKNSISAVEKAFRELDKEEKAQTMQANALFNQLRGLTQQMDMTNASTAERSRLIREINNRYGTYLGFMLKETDSLRTIAAAHDLVISKLKQETLLKKQNAVVETVANSHAEENANLVNSIADMVKGSKRYDGNNKKTKESLYGRENEFVQTLERVIAEEIEKGNRDSTKIIDSIRKELKDKKLWTVRTDLNSKIADLVHLNINAQQEVERNLASVTGQLEGVNKSVNANSVKTLNGLAESISKIQEGGIQDSELAEYVTRMKDYISLAQKNGKIEGQLLSNVNTFQKELSKYQTRLDEWGRNGLRESIWGKKGSSYAKMSTEDLANFIKRYDSIEDSIQDGIKIAETFPEILDKTNGMTEEMIREFLYKEATEARAELDKRNDNKTGDFKWKESGSRKKKLKEELNAYIKQLDEYYNHRKELIEESRNLEEITEEEMNRRIEANEVEHLNARIKLRNGFLHRSNLLTEQEMDELNRYFMNLDEDSIIFTQEGIAKLGKQLKDLFGHSLQQDISLAAQKDATAIQKVLLTHKKKIEEALLDDDFVAKAQKEFFILSDQLDLIFGLGETNRTQQLGEQRLDQLRKWSRNAYTITVDELKESMKDESNIYHDWYVNMGKQADETLPVLLQKLRQFNDDVTEAEKRAANRYKEVFEKRWSSIYGKDGFSMQERENYSKEKKGIAVSAAQDAEGWGFGGFHTTANAELDLIQTEIKWQQLKIDLLKEEQDARIKNLETQKQNMMLELDWMKIKNEDSAAIDAQQARIKQMNDFIISATNERNLMVEDGLKNLADLQQQYLDKDIENQTHYFEKIKELSGHLDSFAENITSNMFGSKEERQQAWKGFLSDVARTLKQALQEQLVEIATTRQVHATKEQLEIAHQQRMSIIKQRSVISTGQAAIAELTAQGSVATAEQAINVARGTGKEVASKGLAGLLTSAAISAALSALLGAALAAINKSKTQVSSVTGNSHGKLTTGMLTYAEGKYPVLGNDGEVYNAKYEKKLTTGIYRGPRFGIFSEKKPEAVIDGETTQKLLLDYPVIWKNILTISKNGRLVNGGGGAMATHAAGTLEEVTRAYTQVTSQSSPEATGNNNDALNNTLQQLIYVLTSGQIKTSIDMHGKNGLRQQLKRADRFMERRNLP